MWPKASSSGEKVKVRGRVGVGAGARWGPPTPAESAPVLLAAVTPLREELPLAAFAVGGGMDFHGRPRKGCLISRQTPHVSPTLSGAREGNSHRRVPPGEEGLTLLTDIFRE